MIVLDSSTVLAVLRDEAGAERAIEMMYEGVITAINLGEVAQLQFRDGFSRVDVKHTIEELAIPIISVDAEMAYSAAEMRMMALAKGMSQADCICLALAKREGVAALTGDRKWLEVADALGVEVKLFR